MKKKTEGSATFNFEGLYQTFMYLELPHTSWVLYFQIEFGSGNCTSEVKSLQNP